MLAANGRQLPLAQALPSVPPFQDPFPQGALSSRRDVPGRSRWAVDATQGDRKEKFKKPSSRRAGGNVSEWAEAQRPQKRHRQRPGGQSAARAEPGARSGHDAARRPGPRPPPARPRPRPRPPTPGSRPPGPARRAAA
ncbi:unnamed protein product [Rangifer tarandus platyrhynchus]|uniref:Uncharacterized protein n=1 Tax=Rangifer tarandus platyrhynchus TaxID=3082113 RepID=A0ABN8YED7_RANTA|nr:unnamed protein product [Rangifer tarandus platyrhynchus]